MSNDVRAVHHDTMAAAFAASALYGGDTITEVEITVTVCYGAVRHFSDWIEVPFLCSRSVDLRNISYLFHGLHRLRARHQRSRSTVFDGAPRSHS